MFDLEFQVERGHAASEATIVDQAEPNQPSEDEGTQNTNQERQRDLLLVEAYKQAASKYGARSEEASLAFAPIFELYWPKMHNRAMQKIGAVYADDLASETLKTVWERLNGSEVVTNLVGLVRHSFDREYATLLEKLFQGRRLSRNQPTEDEGSEPGKLKGAAILSLNGTVSSDNDELELIHTLEDRDANVEEAAARRELVVTLRGLIAQMPAHYRAPLVCQWLLGMKIKDIAEELNLTLDQVKHNTRRGMDWLAKRMPDQADWL